MLTIHLALLSPPTGSDPTSQLEGGVEAPLGDSDLPGVGTCPGMPRLT